MSTPALNLKRETPLNREDPHECLLDNLSRCRDLATQKTVLTQYEAGIRIAERQRLKRDLLSQADDLAAELTHKRHTAQYVRQLLDLVLRF